MDLIKKDITNQEIELVIIAKIRKFNQVVVRMTEKGSKALFGNRVIHTDRLNRFNRGLPVTMTFDKFGELDQQCR